jgi:Ras-related protein Rab-7A
MDARRRKVLGKIIILGDSGVGKTKLMTRMVHDKYTPQYKATIGADFLTKEVTPVEGKSIVTLQIWDTAGQERFQSLGVAFYRGSDACVLAYDVTTPKSFESLKSWQEEFATHAAPRQPDAFPYLVLGLKADLVEQRAVPRATAEAWVKSKGSNFQYMEASSKDGVGMAEIVQRLGEYIVKTTEDEIDYTPAPLLLDTSTPPAPEKTPLEEAFAPLIQTFKDLDEEHHIQELFKKAADDLEAGWKIFEDEAKKALGEVAVLAEKVAEEPAVKEGLETLESFGEQVKRTFNPSSRLEYQMIN